LVLCLSPLPPPLYLWSSVSPLCLFFSVSFLDALSMYLPFQITKFNIPERTRNAAELNRSVQRN
jgi:hypothetical protein